MYNDKYWNVSSTRLVAPESVLAVAVIGNSTANSPGDDKKLLIKRLNDLFEFQKIRRKFVGIYVGLGNHDRDGSVNEVNMDHR